jgi:hypothetical protein
MRKRFVAGIVAAGSAVVFSGFGVLMAPVASALALPPGGLVHAPDYCLAVYGDPSPCPPPDRPEPVDPSCLRVNIQPLTCPYQP